jgi:hypothetical protein
LKLCSQLLSEVTLKKKLLDDLNGTKQENVTPIVAQAEPSNAEISGECVVDCKLGTITEQKQTSTLHHLQKATSNGPSCLSTLDEVAEGPKPEPVGPFFLSSGWRAKLCLCRHCLNMYEETGVSFLLDRDDTLQEYEATGKQSERRPLHSLMVQNQISCRKWVI